MTARVLAALAASALAMAAGLLALPDRGTHDPATTDGRYHQCGLVTEHGVTEYLDTYAERCPNDGDAGQDPANDQGDTTP